MKPVVHFSGTAVPEGDRMCVFALDHPRFPFGYPVITSEVVQVFEDGSFETLNTIYKPILSTVRGVADAARELVETAMKHGLVLTINTVAREPLAMGNYDLVVDVRAGNPIYRGTK